MYRTVEFSCEIAFSVRWRHQPLREIIRDGASLGQAGFAEAVWKIFPVFGIEVSMHFTMNFIVPGLDTTAFCKCPTRLLGLAEGA